MFLWGTNPVVTNRASEGAQGCYPAQETLTAPVGVVWTHCESRYFPVQAPLARSLSRCDPGKLSGRLSDLLADRCENTFRHMESRAHSYLYSLIAP